MIFPAPDRRKLWSLKRASHPGVIIGAIVFVCVLALLAFPDPFVNGFIKPRIIEAFAEANAAYSMSIAGMNYSILRNSFGFDSLALTASAANSQANGAGLRERNHWMHLLWGGSLTPPDYAGSIVEAQNAVLNFPQSQYELLWTATCIGAGFRDST